MHTPIDHVREANRSVIIQGDYLDEALEFKKKHSSSAATERLASQFRRLRTEHPEQVKQITQEIIDISRDLAQVIKVSIPASRGLMQTMHMFNKQYNRPVTDVDFLQFAAEAQAFDILWCSCLIAYRELLKYQYTGLIGGKVVDCYGIRTIPTFPYMESDVVEQSEEWNCILSQYASYRGRPEALPLLDASLVDIAKWEDMLNHHTPQQCMVTISHNPNSNVMSVAVFI